MKRFTTHPSQVYRGREFRSERNQKLSNVYHLQDSVVLYDDNPALYATQYWNADVVGSQRAGKPRPISQAQFFSMAKFFHEALRLTAEAHWESLARAERYMSDDRYRKMIDLNVRGYNTNHASGINKLQQVIHTYEAEDATWLERMEKYMMTFLIDRHSFAIIVDDEEFVKFRQQIYDMRKYQRTDYVIQAWNAVISKYKLHPALGFYDNSRKRVRSATDLATMEYKELKDLQKKPSTRRPAIEIRKRMASAITSFRHLGGGSIIAAARPEERLPQPVR